MTYGKSSLSLETECGEHRLDRDGDVWTFQRKATFLWIVHRDGGTQPKLPESG